jgi:uncharacterized protein (DUF983 family)
VSQSSASPESASAGPDIPQKPKGSAGILFWWIRKLWLGACTICPRCEKGSMFESFFKIRKRCPECNCKLQPYSGDDLGVIAVGYFLTLIPGLIGLLLAWSYTSWTPYQLLFFFFFLITVILIGLYRNMKGIWVALVFILTGFKRL